MQSRRVSTRGDRVGYPESRPPCTRPLHRRPRIHRPVGGEFLTPRTVPINAPKLLGIPISVMQNFARFYSIHFHGWRVRTGHKSGERGTVDRVTFSFSTFKLFTSFTSLRSYAFYRGAASALDPEIANFYDSRARANYIAHSFSRKWGTKQNHFHFCSRRAPAV